MLKQNPDQALLRRWRPGLAEPLRLEASPMALALDGRVVRVEPEAGRIALAFTPGPQFLQGMAVVQGGAVSAMLDFALGFCALAHLPDDLWAATASLNVSFLRPAPAGTYIAEGEIERSGRSLIFTRGRLYRAGKAPVATGSATMAVLPWKAEG